MIRLKGTVKDNVIVLDEGVRLPEGAEVEVRVRTRKRRLDAAIERVQTNPILRYIGIDDVMAEDKQEREERGGLGE